MIPNPEFVTIPASHSIISLKWRVAIYSNVRRSRQPTRIQPKRAKAGSKLSNLLPSNLDFNQIFDGLCKLFADVDVDVKNGANLLDRLIKDIVTESESFDVERFIPLLQKYIRRTNPYIRQLLVGWITVLDSVPDINMLDWLPDFLDGLFNMLSDGNRGQLGSKANL